MDLKAAGNAVYLVGGRSTSLDGTPVVPDVPETAPAVYRALYKAIGSGLVKSCHDLSEGGLAVAAAEMCIGGRLGLVLDETLRAEACFAEVNGCLLAEIDPGSETAFRALFADLPLEKIGVVVADPVLKFSGTAVPVADLVRAFTGQD